MLHFPVTREAILGKALETLTNKLAASSLNFDSNTLEECSNIAELRRAGAIAIDARKSAENLVMGKISKLKTIMSQTPMKILKGLDPVSKNFQTQQILSIMGEDSEPIVLLDEQGAMAAVKVGEITTATKPAWLDSITLFRDSRPLAYGNDYKNERIDRNTFKRKSKFANQAIQNEVNYSKAEYFRNKQRRFED